MTEYQAWYEGLQVERTMKALRKNNFDAQFVAKATDAVGVIFKMIPDGATVGVGGSMTLNQIGFFEEAAQACRQASESLSTTAFARRIYTDASADPAGRRFPL